MVRSKLCHSSGFTQMWAVTRLPSPVCQPRPCQPPLECQQVDGVRKERVFASLYGSREANRSNRSICEFGRGLRLDRGKSRCLSASQPRHLTSQPDLDFERCDAAASSTVVASQRPDRKASLATVTGKPKRRGPALPGLTKKISPRFSIAGLCEWPDTTAVKPAAAGSRSSLRKVVKNVNRVAANLDNVVCRKAASPRPLIVIASDRARARGFRVHPGPPGHRCRRNE
jgi:hypothetical protein